MYTCTYPSARPESFFEKGVQRACATCEVRSKPGEPTVDHFKNFVFGLRGGFTVIEFVDVYAGAGGAGVNHETVLHKRLCAGVGDSAVYGLGRES
jgi:hypothetical protein